MRVTIKDIAELMNISASTVSRALGGSSKISNKTREQIKKIARKLNYQPNITAQGLISGKTHNIGVILNKDIREYTSVQIFNSIIINGILEVAEAHNYNLNFAVDAGVDKLGALSRIIENEDVDGVLIINVVSEDILAKLCVNKIPVVLIDNHFDNTSAFAVNNDDQKGAYIATTHLISLGYKSIGLMGIAEEAFQRECRLGFLQALADHGLKANSNFIRKANGGLESAYEEITKMIKQGHVPRGIFAINDEMAIGAIKAIKDKGLRVPGDTAVVGMDDMPLLDYIDTPLTTMRIHIAEMGRVAVQMLLDLIQGKYLGKKQIAISPKLVIRKSCGAYLFQKD